MKNYKTFIDVLNHRKKTYLMKLENELYSETSIRSNNKTISAYIRIYKKLNKNPSNPTITEARTYIPLTIPILPKSAQKPATIILERFLHHLKNCSEFKKLRPKARLDNKIQKERDIVISEFADYLKDLRGLTDKSIKTYSSFFRIFLDYQFANKELNFKSITRDNIIEFLIAIKKTAPRTNSLSSSMRNVCNFYSGRDTSLLILEMASRHKKVNFQNDCRSIYHLKILKNCLSRQRSIL